MSTTTNPSQAFSDQQVRATSTALSDTRRQAARRQQAGRPKLGFDEILLSGKKPNHPQAPMIGMGAGETAREAMLPRASLLLDPHHRGKSQLLTAGMSPVHDQQARAQMTQEDLEKQMMADQESKIGHGLDPLDPVARQTAQLASPTTHQNPNQDPAALATATAQRSSPSPSTDDAVAPRAKVSMEDLLPQLVKRIAWAGDRKNGTVQMELGAGRHAGTVVTVHANAGRVRVELDGHGPDLASLREKIDARLKRQGIPVESVT